MLVFTQYVAMARLLERHLAERGMPHPAPARRHAGAQARGAGAAVPGRRGAGVPALAARPAAPGLNLTRADHVIHYDRWWNPAVEDQATDRAYRIGQTRPVQVHRLIAEGTIEDRIAAMLQAKRELADAVLRVGRGGADRAVRRRPGRLVELRTTTG